MLRSGKKSASFTILEVQGLLKSNTCSCMLHMHMIASKTTKQVSAHITILESVVTHESTANGDNV